jgi:hypothetical protein
MNRGKYAYDPAYAVDPLMRNATRYVTSPLRTAYTPMPPYRIAYTPTPPPRLLPPIPPAQPRPLPPTPAVSASMESAPVPPPRPSKRHNSGDVFGPTLSSFVEPNILQSSVLSIPSTLVPTSIANIIKPLEENKATSGNSGSITDPFNTIPNGNIKPLEENKATSGNSGSIIDPFNTIPSGNIKPPEENKATSGNYKYSYIIATDSINDTSSTNDADENSNSNSYEPNMPFNILKERVKSLNDAGDKIYVIVKIKSKKNKKDLKYKDQDLPVPVVNKSIKIDNAPIYTIYKNYKKILNIERNAGEERLYEALNDFKNACVIKYGDNCVIISYANEEETIKNKLIDFDDTLELLFDIRFKKVRLAAIPGVKDFITKLDDNGEDNIIKAETVKTPDISSTTTESKNHINVNKEGMINYNGIDIPHTKEGIIDVNKIEEIGKQKNPNFVIDSHERSDLDEINIVNTINILDDKNLPLNANVPSMHILGDIIPKIKKLLNGTNYRFHSPN